MELSSGSAWKSGWYDTQPTVLLIGIIDRFGVVVCDHLWFNLTKGFESLSLQEGDVVQFDARTSDYMKGYVRESELIDEREVDYKLSYPTKIKKLSTLIASPAKSFISP